MVYLRRLWSRTLYQTLLSLTWSADLFCFLSVPHHSSSFCFLILHLSSAPWTSVGPRTVTAPPQSFQHPAPPFSPANPHSSYTYSDNSFTGVSWCPRGWDTQHMENFYILFQPGTIHAMSLPSLSLCWLVSSTVLKAKTSKSPFSYTWL